MGARGDRGGLYRGMEAERGIVRRGGGEASGFGCAESGRELGEKEGRCPPHSISDTPTVLLSLSPTGI